MHYLKNNIYQIQNFKSPAPHRDWKVVKAEGTPKHEKICHICNKGQIDDEYRYVLEYQFGEWRKKISV